MAISEGSEVRLRHEVAGVNVRRRVVAAVVLAFALTLGAALLGLALMQRGLAVLWPAAGVVAGLWLITPSHYRLHAAVVLGIALFTGNLIAGRPLPVNVMFVVANLGEAWLIGVLLTRWVGRPIRQETLRQAAAFIAAVAVTVVVGGAIGAAILSTIPGIGQGYLHDWGMWVSARGIGFLTVTPAIVALGSLSPQSLLNAWRQQAGTFLAILAVALVTYVLVSIDADRGALLSLLLLLSLVYPLILLIAARSEPTWTYVALLLVTLIVVWRLGHGGGLFGSHVEAAQGFLLLSSLWSLTLAVVMHEQRRAIDLARRNELSMRHALAAGRGFTFDYDPRADHVLRLDPDQILAPFSDESGSSFFARVLPEDRARLQQLVTSLSPVKPMYETTYGSRRPDGKVVWLQERGVGEFDEHGTLRRLQGLTMDITARREAEEALREADRKKDRFIATLAHELRNPLAPIRTAAELLGSSRAGSNEIEWARQVIKRQVRHMGMLLDDLLDVARITRGKLQIRKQTVRLDTVIDTAVEVARPLIDAREHTLVIQVPAPAPVLEADPLRLSQVISNLLTNAAKYSDPGGRITLAVTTRDSVLELKVTDTGIGIPPDSLQSVFKMFSQVHDTVGRSEGGLGIGLSLVKGLVELHGGTVAAHSAGPGTGSEFVVTLPYTSPEHPESDAKQARPEAAPAPRLRILVVDDNQDAADSLGLLLGLDGHDVRVAYAGRAAIEIGHAFKPHIAILDLGLPDLSGYDVARLLRQDPALGTVELIALTGWGQEEHKRRALEAGFDHHVTKPVDLELLATLLKPPQP